MWTSLLYVNRSFEARPPTVLLWEELTQDRPGSVALVSRPWRVIRECGHGMSHDIRFSHELRASIGDGSGNQSVPIGLVPGGEYAIVDDTGSARLVLVGHDQGHRYSVRNESPISVLLSIHRSGSVVADGWVGSGRSTSWSDDRELRAAGLTWRPPSWDALLRDSFVRPTTLRLHGVRRAEVVMVGGGPGARSRPLSFHSHDVESW